MARAIGKPPTTVQGWKDSSSIPDREKPGILQAAKRGGIALSPVEFFPICDACEASSQDDAA